MNVHISAPAAGYLRRLYAKGRTARIEVHAYALGARNDNEVRIEHFVSAGTPRATSTMIEPDYAASAKAITPYLKHGHALLGEAHSHLALVGPSAGDLQTLASISEQYHDYLCIVIAPGNPDHTITAHTVEEGRAIPHAVISEEYQLPEPRIVRKKSLLVIGAGSGLAAATPALLKLGFHTITIADADRIESRNIERHFATTRDVGKPKVDAFKRFARGRTTSHIRTINKLLTSDSRDLFGREIARHNCTLNATGHPVVSRTISYLARQHRKPVIHAGVFARGSGGFVFLDRPNGPCYSCLFPLQLAAEADDTQTLHTLTDEYGLTEAELSAQLGLWTDVNVVAAFQTKVLLEYLKGKTTPSLYVIDNDRVSVTHHKVPRRNDCICKGGQ